MGDSKSALDWIMARKVLVGAVILLIGIILMLTCVTTRAGVQDGPDGFGFHVIEAPVWCKTDGLPTLTLDRAPTSRELDRLTRCELAAIHWKTGVQDGPDGFGGRK